MVFTASTRALFPIHSSPQQARYSNVGISFNHSSEITIFSKHHLKARSQFSVPLKINNHAIVSHTTLPEKIKKIKEFSSPTQKSEFISHLLDGSVSLTEKQWATLTGIVSIGRLVQDGLVFRQNFSIRSYEICGNRNASIEILMNHLQEASLNHVRSMGLLNDGLGLTPEMSRRNLIWVVAKVKVQVDRYPCWGDVVQVDTWISESGKNGIQRDWLILDPNTGETLASATSVLVLMNKSTRKLSKFPGEVRGELEPYFREHEPILDNGSEKLRKLSVQTSDFVQTGLTPRWNDLDVNQHVNNVKYVRWILENCPPSISSSHELFGITLEYRKECEMDNMLQSLTAICGHEIIGSSMKTMVECDHTLLFEDGSEIVRGRTTWRPILRTNRVTIVGR